MSFKDLSKAETAIKKEQTGDMGKAPPVADKSTKPAENGVAKPAAKQ